MRRTRLLAIAIGLAGATLLVGRSHEALGQPAPPTTTPTAPTPPITSTPPITPTPTPGSAASGGECGKAGAASAAGSGSLSRQTALGAAGADSPVDVPLIDTAVPDAPAFAFLGVTPTQIAQPQTARELGVAAASVIGSDGKLHQGVAIEWTPYKTFGAPTLATYEQLYPLRNLQLSLATSQGVGAGVDAAGVAATATDAALGIRSTLWNPDDPVIVLKQRYLEAVSAARELATLYHVGPPTDDGAAVDFCKILEAARAGKAADGSDHPALIAAAAKLDARHKALAAAEADLKKKWNQTAIAIGAAIGERFPDSLWKNHTFRGWAGWGTLAYGFKSYGQVVVTGRFHSEAKTDTPGDTSLVGARLILGGARFAGFGEFAWNWLRPADELTLAKDNWGQAALGFEIKLGDKTWLVAAFGGTLEKSDQQSDFFASSNFKWSFGDKTLPLGPIK